MQPMDVTLTRDQALIVDRNLSKIRKKVVYIQQFDCELVYRLGSKDDTKITKVRIREDARPQQRKDRITGNMVDKVNDIITYAENNELFVLAKSGGISLFDAMSPKLTLRKNDCWYVIPKDTPIPDGISVAKDRQVDRNGHFHYALQPAYDMPLAQFQEKLSEFVHYMRQI